MDLRDLSKSNRGQILRYTLQTGGASRVDIARALGLAISTVTEITGLLVQRGVLCEKANHYSGKRGRPKVELAFDNSRTLTIVAGYDDGVASAHLVQPDGEIVRTEQCTLSVGHDEDHFSNYILSQKQAIDELGRGIWDLVHSIVIKGTGMVSSTTGEIILSTLYGWRNRQVVDHFRGFGKPVFLQNTTRLRAVAENWYGAAQDVDDFLFFHLDSGIGGAVVLDGALVEGPSHGAGEFGHTMVDPNGPVCACGRKGCLETVASIGSILRAVNCDDRRDIRHTWELYGSGDAGVAEAFDRAISALTDGILNAVISVGPKTVVLGGRMVDETGGEIVDVLRESIRATNTVFSDLDIRQSRISDEESQTLGGVAYGLQEMDV